MRKIKGSVKISKISENTRTKIKQKGEENIKVTSDNKKPAEFTEILRDTLNSSENGETVKSAIISSIIKKASEKGDTKAADWIISKLNENKNDENNENGDNNDKINPKKILKNPGYNGIPGYLLGRAFTDIYRDICERRNRFYDFKGGRGSLKSSFCALILIDVIMRNKNFCAIALRQVKDTLRNSVYAQITGAIERLGLSEYFTYTTSPLQIKKNDTGQIIYFRGCNDPIKIKSIKPPDGMYIGVVWFEEKDQLKGSEAVRNIQQSVMRGGDDIIVLSSYNTPMSRRHFLNKEETDLALSNQANQNRIIHYSSYLEAPPEWLGQPFLDEAEYLKNTNEKAYNHEYLGMAIGESGSVFENVTAKPFTVEDNKTIREFERFYFGVDWGFYPDPWAFVKCCYDTKNRALYIIDEAAAVKKSNHETADILLNEIGIKKDDLVICDSSEPKSVADYVSYGIYARGAEKGSISSRVSNGGSGSVAYSMRWLQGLNKIIIDAGKCPGTAKEFLDYEYEHSADGEILSGYPDKDNHFIDAVRYATNMLWRNN